MNRRHRLRALAAELAKLRTLPAVVATLLGTVAAAAVLAGSLAAANDGRGDGIAITLETIPILQVGTILVGVLAAPSEYAGSQIRTTLIAVPKRVRAFAAKALAYRVVATVTSAVAVVVAFVTAWAALGSDLAARRAGRSPARPAIWWRSGCSPTPSPFCCDLSLRRWRGRAHRIYNAGCLSPAAR